MSIESFYRKIIRTAKRNYEKELFEKCKNDSKSIWRNINSVLGKNRHKKNIPSKINDESGIKLTNMKQISNAFNKYYVNVGPNLAKTIDNSNPDYKKHLPKVVSHESLFLLPTNEDETSSIIKLLKPKTSFGHDNISPKYLKKLYTGIVTPCVHIINLSLSTGIVPDSMKLAKVVPIFKNSGSDEVMKNYRPVSLLPVLSKVLERIVYNRLFKFLIRNKLLHPSQYGFQENLGTELAILELQDRINDILKKKECCVGVFMDLSKAFDTLDHNILLDKLNHYGICGVSHDWFRNYLSNRKQYVSIDGINSTQLDVSCGVPQGSILGPLLFLIYVNDLATVSKDAVTVLFADDTNTIYRSKTYSELNKVINEDLPRISNWFKTNKLALNETKTKFIIFHTRHNNPPPTFQIILNNVELERVEYTKFFGILIQENLSWGTHINYICEKVSRTVALLARLKHYLPKSVMMIIFNSLCLSHISYALSVWGASPKSIMNRMVKLQKKGIRHVCNSKYNAHTQPLFKDNRVLQINDLFNMQCAKTMYKKKQSILPSYHCGQLITNFERRQLNTRQRYDVDIFRCKTILTQINSINYKVGKSWNELPFETKEATFKSMSSFARHIKNLYLSKYSDTCIIPDCYVCKQR